MKQLIHDVKWILRFEFGRLERLAFILRQWFAPKNGNCLNCSEPHFLNIEGRCADCWFGLHGAGNDVFLYNEAVTKGLKEPEPDDENNRFGTRYGR